MREPREPTHFESRPTPIVGEFSALLWVNESFIRDGLTLAKGTALKDFMADQGVPKDDAINRGFGDHVLTEQVAKQDGYHGFYFLKPRTAEQIATAFSEMENDETAPLWPAVLLSISNTPINRYQTPGGGSQYTERYNWSPVFKEAYDGLYKVIEREYWSHEEFTLTMPTPMQPRGEFFDYVLGTFTLKPCLHGDYAWNFSTGTSNYLYPLITSSTTWSATTPTDWPDSIVIANGQRRFEGGYIRREVTAYKPY